MEAVERKQAYERPKLRKVRLDIKTSVLSVCRTSLDIDPAPSCQTPEAGCWFQ